ncbi:MAG: hypothetical protein QXT14_02800 [Candidatus Bathyarchaeia archaeon]
MEKLIEFVDGRIYIVYNVEVAKDLLYSKKLRELLKVEKVIKLANYEEVSELYKSVKNNKQLKIPPIIPKNGDDTPTIEVVVENYEEKGIIDLKNNQIVQFYEKLPKCAICKKKLNHRTITFVEISTKAYKHIKLPLCPKCALNDRRKIKRKWLKC